MHLAQAQCRSLSFKFIEKRNTIHLLGWTLSQERHDSTFRSYQILVEVGGGYGFEFRLIGCEIYHVIMRCVGEDRVRFPVSCIRFDTRDPGE